MKGQIINVRELEISNSLPLVIIAGPCAMESQQHAMDMAGAIRETCNRYGLPHIYKTSFDKANRTSPSSGRGVGIEDATPVFDALQKAGHLVVTDIHEPWHVQELETHVDMLQIPALLSRQTDLIHAAVTNKMGLPVNLKKGQFMSPDQAITAAINAGDVILTERGTSFGYERLVVDMAGVAKIKSTGIPVVMDATHAVQQPGSLGGRSGGDRRYATAIARAAVSLGIAGVFMEVHQDPDNAPCDGPNMIDLKHLDAVISVLAELDHVAKADPWSLV